MTGKHAERWGERLIETSDKGLQPLARVAWEFCKGLKPLVYSWKSHVVR